MKEKNAKNKGITLIALVITIIVLLILAAVSIATLTGENGILTKATKAKENTETEEEKEQIRLAYTAALANNKDNFEVTATDLGEELSKLTSEATVSGNEGGFTIIFTKSNYTHTYTLDSEGNITNSNVSEGQKPQVRPEDSWQTLASQIDANNYGDFVDYEMDLNNDNNTTNDWKIFYSENGRVFLIAANYLDYTKNNGKIDFTNTKLNKSYAEEGGKYSLNWLESSLPEVESDGIEANLFKATKYDITNSSYSSNINAKCVYALLNTSYWKNFVNSNYADKAIGSPTLEMWVASWNGKGNLKGKEKYTELTASATEGSYGYKINDNTDFDLSTSGTGTDSTGYHDKLYFPHHEGVNTVESLESGDELVATNETYGYWLASSSALSNNALCYVNYSGYVNHYRYNYSNNDYGVRPIVSLKSGIKGNKDSDVWKLATKH